MLYALAVLGSKFVQLARLEVYRVDSTGDRLRIRETLEHRGEAGLLKDFVSPPFWPSEAHVCRGKFSDFVEGP